MKKNIKFIASVIIAVVLAFPVILEKIKTEMPDYMGQIGEIETEKETSKETVDQSGFMKAEIVRVVDGDTFVVNLNGSEEKLRLIGVDTPESKHPDKSKNTKEGIIASDYAKSIADKGDEAFLEFDVSERDRYGRLLVYLHLRDKNGNLYMYNEDIIRKGYARTMTVPPNVKYSDRFTEIQKNAREKGLGFWKNEDSAWK